MCSPQHLRPADAGFSYLLPERHATRLGAGRELASFGHGCGWGRPDRAVGKHTELGSKLDGVRCIGVFELASGRAIEVMRPDLPAPFSF
jgi:hypothetical protein